jgi:hypothetical protein
VQLEPQIKDLLEVMVAIQRLVAVAVEPQQQELLLQDLLLVQVVQVFLQQ